MNRFWLKALLNALVVIPMLMWFTEATFLGSLITSLGLSVIAYLIGDQMILRATNNMVATIADAGLSFVYLWAVAAFANWNFTWGELLFTVALLGVLEYFFHLYLRMNDKTETPQKGR